MTGILNIYARVSSRAQEEKEWSLEEQIEVGGKVADKHGLEPKIWNEGGVSSNDLEELSDLPKLFDMFEELKESKSDEKQHVYIWSVERLGRDSIQKNVVLNELIKNNCILYTGTGNEYDFDNPEDEFTVTVLSAVGRLDNAMRAKRSRAGKLRAAKAGLWLGGVPPFGYDLNDRMLVVNEYEKRWVIKIYEMYLEGLSVAQIARELFKNGVKTKKGKDIWSNRTIELMLFDNTVYKGFRTVKEQVHNNPALMSEEEWMAPKLKRTKRTYRKSNAVKRLKQDYVFSQIATCGECGNPLRVRNKYSSDRSKIIGKSYYCGWKENKRNRVEEELWSRERSSGQCGMRRSIDGEEMDEVVFNKIIEVLYESKEFERKFKDRVMGDSYNDSISKSKRINNLNQYLRKAKSDIEDLNRSLEDLKFKEFMKEISEDDASSFKNRIIGRINDIQGEINKYENEKSSIDTKEVKVDWFEKYGEEMEVIRYATIKEKREFIEPVVDSVKVYLNDDRKSHRIEVQMNVRLFDYEGLFSGDGFKSDVEKIVSGGFVEIELKKNWPNH